MNSSHLAAILEEIATLPEFAPVAPLTPQSRSGVANTPLHVAAIRGDVSAMTTLIDAGADIDARGEHGYTSLHEAVGQGHGTGVSLLLSRGASAHIADDDGRTPQQLAELLGAHEITRLFHEQQTA